MCFLLFTCRCDLYMFFCGCDRLCICCLFLKQNRYICRIFQLVVSCLYVKCLSGRKYTRYLSFYFIMSRIIQGLSITLATITLFYTTKDWNCVSKFLCVSYEARTANEGPFQAFIFITLTCYILQAFFYMKFFDSMHLGTSLLRDTRSLLKNHQFSGFVCF